MSKTKTIYLFILLMIVIAFAACEKSTSISVTNTFTPTPTVVDTPTPTPTLSPANMITATPTDRITSTATPTVLPITEADMEESPVEDKVTNKLIAIDAGHQKKGNYEEEPIGPGATATKPKVSSGTEGAFTGVAEYELTLIIASKLKEELINRGYDVYMIREIHEVNLSNKERAEMANESGADLFLRIHADGSTNSDVNGASTLYPSEDNPYVPDLSISSYSLSKSVIDSLCEETGAKNRGAIARDDMSGINWCTLPVTIIEMGYMSNQTEDELMQTKDYRNKIVQGICNGIDTYYED